MISAIGQFWIFAATELPINEEKVFQTSVPVSDGNNFIHNINIEELYCLLFVNPDTRDWSAQNCVGVIVRSIKYLENNETKLHYLHLEGTRNTEKKDGKFEARNFVA